MGSSPDKTRQSPSRLGLVVATTLGVVSLLIGGLFVVRTRLVAGPFVRDQLTDWATRHEASLQVDSMRPTGLFGLRLDDVSLRLSRGPATVGLEEATLEVYPSLWALIRGRAAVDAVALRGGEIWIAPRAENQPEHSGAEASSPSPPSDPPASSSSGGAPAPAPAPLSVEVVIDQVDLRARLGVTTGRPVRIRRAELKVGATDRPSGIARLSGYGTFPGNVPFSLSATPADAKESAGGPLEFSVSASRPAALSRLVGLDLPADLTIETLRFCPECSSARLCLEPIDIRARGVQFQAPSACARRRGNHIEIRAGEFNILQNDEVWPFRLSEFRVDLFGDSGPFTLEATLDGNTRGQVRLHSRFDPDRDVLVSTFATDQL
ncbi:MAG: hypothetical protein ABEN55_08230, partial [Bradymonadaceae bacterium]